MTKFGGFYTEVCVHEFQKFVHSFIDLEICCLALERGDVFLARYEDRLLFIRVISSGWNFAYLQIKGLEMQEQTSCHHHVTL